MLELLCKDVIEDVQNAQIQKLFVTDGTEVLSKRSLPSYWITAPIAIFVRRKAHSAMDERYSVTFASKKPMDTVNTDENDSKLPPSRSDCEIQEISGKISSKCRSKHPNRKQRNKNVKRRSSSFKSS